MDEKEKLHGFSDEHVQLIRDTVGKDAANEAEFQRFLHRAWKLGLDPLDNSIHLTCRKKKIWDPEKRVETWEKTKCALFLVNLHGNMQ